MYYFTVLESEAWAGSTGLQPRAAGLHSCWGLQGRSLPWRSSLHALARGPCLHHLQSLCLWPSCVPLTRTLWLPWAHVGNPGKSPYLEILNHSCEVPFGRSGNIHHRFRGLGCGCLQRSLFCLSHKASKVRLLCILSQEVVEDMLHYNRAMNGRGEDEV